MSDTLAGWAFDSQGFTSSPTDVPLLRGINVKPGSLDWSETVYWDTAKRPVPDEFALAAGDLVIGMDRPFVGKGVRVATVEPHDLPALLLQRVMRLRPTASADAGYLRYLFSTQAFVTYLAPLFTGVSVPHVSEWQVRKFVMPLPPTAKQGAIADFLDRETAQIDTLIAKQEQLIATLRERRDAAWESALDELSRAWPSAPLRRAIRSIVDGPFGSSLTSAHYSDSGARVIRLGNIGINEFKDKDAVYISDEYYAAMKSHSVEEGDVVVAGLGDEKMPLGRAAVVPNIGHAIVKADCYRIRPSSAVSADYLAWTLSSPASRRQIALLSRGSTRARLNTSVVREVLLPMPPLEQQESAFAVSQEATAKIDLLIEKAGRFIELSKERRSALISAAVTGQIDVSNR